MGAPKQNSQPVEKGIQLIQFPLIIDQNAIAEFEAAMNQRLLDPATLHVFDFSNTVKVDQAFFRIITVYRRQLVKNGKFLCSLGLREELAGTVARMGLSDVFNVKSSMEQAKRQAGLSMATTDKASIDSNILKMFIEGTVNALKVQCSVEVTSKAPSIKRDAGLNTDIAGVIGVNNGKMPGSIALCFPKAVFLGIYESMVGEKHSEINQEIQDGAGELLNIIYGHAKAQLSAQGMKLSMAIPVVLVGEKIRMQIGEAGKSVILPFECKYGGFHLEVYFKKG